MSTPQPDPADAGPGPGPGAAPERPGLYVVDTSVAATTSTDIAEKLAEPTDGTPAEPTGETPAASAVDPLAPWDQRVLDSIERVLAARPGWTTTPPSYAQTWAYSRHGDWTTREGGLRRAGHSALVLVAVGVLFPLDWVLNVVRDKPIGLVLVTTVVTLLVLAV